MFPDFSTGRNVCFVFIGERFGRGWVSLRKKKNSPAVAISAGLWYNTDKESAVWQTVSTFPANQLQEMIARVG